MPSTRSVITTLFITLFTTIGIFKCLHRAQASVTPQSRTTYRPQVIDGRWQLVRSSLGLEPLPTAVSMHFPTVTTLPSHRIDFRWHRRSTPTPLRFAHDALREPRVSLKELVVSFRRVAHEEAKADAPRPETKKGRTRPGRNSIRKGNPAIPH